MINEIHITFSSRQFAQKMWVRLLQYWQGVNRGTVLRKGCSKEMCLERRNTNIEKEEWEVHGEFGINNRGNQASGACCGWLVIESYSCSTLSSAQSGR